MAKIPLKLKPKLQQQKGTVRKLPDTWEPGKGKWYQIMSCNTIDYHFQQELMSK